MTNHVGPTGPSRGGMFSAQGSDVVPPGPPLPANSPWVKALAQLFPHVPVGELELYAAKFRDNMFSALNSQIQRDAKAAKRAARQFKESIRGG